MKFTTLLFVAALAGVLDCVQASDSADSASSTGGEPTVPAKPALIQESSEELEMPELKYFKFLLAKGLSAAKAGAYKARAGVNNGIEDGKQFFSDTSELLKGLREKFYRFGIKI